MTLLDRFPCLLLDMNGTFMFDQDRFGDDEDFHATYRAVGGVRLTPAAVTRHIRACYAALCTCYDDPACYDDFPSLAEGFAQFSDAPHEEIDRLVQVFARHECGTIPPGYANFIRKLARTHRLALVANIWAPKTLWVEELARAGLHDTFHARVFSSDTRSVKPSPRLFNTALEKVSAAPDDALFVGDSLRCDMEGAKAAGLTTVWITESDRTDAAVDYRIGDLLQLADLSV